MRRPRRLFAELVGAALAAGVVAGCAASVTPRLPESVAAALAATPMRRLETPDLILYYPEPRRDDALRFLGHVEPCVWALRARALVHNDFSDAPIVLLLPELPFNNAFVAPRAFGYETMGVVPTYDTTDVFALESGLPPDPGAIACHELTHYVHFQQLAGFASFMNSIFGQAYTPQLGLDSWFDEGLAVYYETLLQPGIGRLSWPFWQGSFAAGVAGRSLGGGDLSGFNRQFHAGNDYLVGSQFVRFLVTRYGEYKLWKLIELQAQSIFFPLGIDVRFWQAYDKSLSTLIDDFAADVALRVPVRARPPEQRVLRAAGNSARYARAADGTEALIVEDRDVPTRVQVFAPDGRLLVDRGLTDVAPPRTLTQSAPSLSGGMSFTADGRALFFVALDQGVTYQAARLLRLDVATGDLRVVARDLRGVGGSVSADGRRYVFARADGDHHDLAELDVATGAVRVLAAQPHGAFVAQPRYSPDGARIVATVHAAGQRFALALFDAATGRAQGVLPTGTMQVTDASWAGDDRIVFLGSPTGDQGFQVYVHDLRDGRTTLVTHAPYLAFAPQAADGRTVRFLNREGWAWTVDEVALPPRAPPPELAPFEPSPPDDTTTLPDFVPPPEPSPPPVATTPPLWPLPRPLPSLIAPAIVSEGPYHAFPSVLIPQLVGPTFAVVGRQGSILGLFVQGADRLEQHRWFLAGYYQPVSSRPSFQLAYVNRQLAPYSVILAASQLSVLDVPDRAPGSDPITNADFVLPRRERVASLDVARTFYDNPVALGASFIESYRPHDLDFAFVTRRLAGPHVSATYAGLESTAYTGVRRLLLLSTEIAAYPQPWNSLGYGIVDTRVEVAGTMPLPLARGHTLTLGVRGRDLVGAGAANQKLLQLGGSLLGTLWQGSPEAPTSQTPFLPTGQPFFEPLRGFEDYPIALNRTAIFDASYRYRIIIDRGWASTLWLLPALFVRQIDLTLFGTAAAGLGWHEAAGGAVTLRIAFGPVAFGVVYQAARRLTDDRGFVQLVALTL